MIFFPTVHSFYFLFKWVLFLLFANNSVWFCLTWNPLHLSLQLFCWILILFRHSKRWFLVILLTRIFYFSLVYFWYKTVLFITLPYFDTKPEIKLRMIHIHINIFIFRYLSYELNRNNKTHKKSFSWHFCLKLSTLSSKMHRNTRAYKLFHWIYPFSITIIIFFMWFTI